LTSPGVLRALINPRISGGCWFVPPSHTIYPTDICFDKVACVHQTSPYVPFLSLTHADIYFILDSSPALQNSADQASFFFLLLLLGLLDLNLFTIVRSTWEVGVEAGTTFLDDS
jgi:hypothetical protein